MEGDASLTLIEPCRVVAKVGINIEKNDAFWLLVNEYKAADKQEEVAWLLERWPDGKYQDVIGLCKVAKLEGEDGLKDQDYSLNAGRYVGEAGRSSVTECILPNVLRNALMRINPQIDLETIEIIVSDFRKDYSGTDMVDTNFTFYNKIRNGIKVKTRNQHHEKNYVIHQGKVIDLSKLDVDALRKEISSTPYKALEIDDLRSFIEELLKQLINKNCPRIVFSQRYKNIIDAYNKGGSENEDLPESYDKPAFDNMTTLLLNHFIDMAVQGYGWFAA